LDGWLLPPFEYFDYELDAIRKVGEPVHRIVGVALAGCEAQHALK
jgi:hypothetical protein